MLGDFFTEPLQGTQFAQMRSKMLNLPSSSSTDVHRRVLKQSKILDSTKPSSGEAGLGTTKLLQLATRLNRDLAIFGGKDGK